VSWATVIVFAAAIVFSLVLFTTRYSECHIHPWDGQTPLAAGFWSSRAVAHSKPCANQPCFALGRRTEGPSRTIRGVYEYIPFITDGVISVLALSLLLGLGAWLRPSGATRNQAFNCRSGGHPYH
jgi:hypothetical protein